MRSARAYSDSRILGSIFGPVFPSAENDGKALSNAQPHMGPKGPRGHWFPLGDPGEDCVWANPNKEDILKTKGLSRASDRTVDSGSPKITPRSFWCSVKCIFSLFPSV
ncbi:hypothetical protein BS47DRAFT_1046492 [Hydnum rufescens UP504]|uniref:Uncharacterized protein n=1 Tax=Hydnum rufescens UP504 TaxID=1448309 RepID=A0A9P6AVS9_9AGAM|nr:hypothetical protein BS47DRAFT_1046492 [Hydnum rufescens UP504]